ncbi:hypothetical protein V2J09_003970, partial [Rumex salicifolius]
LIGDWTTDLEKVEGVVEELWAQLRVRDARIALLTERKARLKAEKLQIEQRYHEHVKRLEEEVGKWLADKEGGTSSGAEEIGVAKPTNGEEPSAHLVVKDAMTAEFKALDINNTWDNVSLPKGKKAIGC